MASRYEIIGKPSFSPRNRPDEVFTPYALTDALAIEGLDGSLESAVEDQRRELTAERRRMQNQMQEKEDSQPAEWMEGIDDLSPGSFALLTVTVLFPA